MPSKESLASKHATALLFQSINRSKPPRLSGSSVKVRAVPRVNITQCESLSKIQKCGSFSRGWAEEEEAGWGEAQGMEEDEMVVGKAL